MSLGVTCSHPKQGCGRESISPRGGDEWLDQPRRGRRDHGWHVPERFAAVEPRFACATPGRGWLGPRAPHPYGAEGLDQYRSSERALRNLVQ